ncbi:NADPH-dependent F420 reductase [Herbiconiux solani]|uniref:NADPH-dependent F420 reductase n=1 Tax=Herbiconiux solani TaxID=661329 RepID=UPI00082693BC|nr:NAD(P)-binding domain-containing protein [Herbiconiux solani]
MTTLGLIGAGAIATAIATRAAAAGIDRITLSNSRGPESLQELAGRIGGSAVAGTAQAASEEDIVVVSVPWSHVPEALGQVDSWTGKILIDTTNPIEAPTFVPFDLGDSTSSEIVATHAPGARVIKAFNTLSPAVLGSSPQVGQGTRVIFFSGDDADAKAAVGQFVTALGFEAIDLGSLRDGGRLHQFPGGPLAGRDLIQF